MLQEQHTSDDAGESIPDWLNTLGNSPSRFEIIPPFASAPSTSSTSSPPATFPPTAPHLRKRKRPPPRKPLQPSHGNQGPPPRSSLKRKMNSHDNDAEELLSRELRNKAKLKKPAKYRDEKEQVLHSRHGLGRGLGSPQKQQSKGRGRGAASSQVRAIDGGQQLLAGPGFVPYGIGAAKPTTPLKGQGRGFGSPDRRPQSPSKSSQASDRTGWMARLNPGVRFLSPSECLKDRQVTQSARDFWLNYIRSDDNECFIPNYFRVSDVLPMPCLPHRAC